MMKQQLKRWVLLTSITLSFCHTFAQRNAPLFNLKQGDWFVMRADVNLSPEHNRRLHQINKDTRQKSTYWLRFTLHHTAPDGHQTFDIRLVRYRHDMATRGHNRPIRRNSFDSFYPAYQQGGPASDTLPSYLFEVAPSGKIRIERSGEPHATTLVQTGKTTDFSSTVQITLETLRDDILMLLGNLITLPQGKGTAKQFALPDGTAVTAHVSNSQQHGKSLKETISLSQEVQCRLLRPMGNQVPTLISTSSGLTLVMVAASFELPGNAVVRGAILHPSSTDSVKIAAYNGSPLSVSPSAVRADGSFELSILLETATSCTFQYGREELMLFLSPGDTLSLTADAADMDSNYSFAGSTANNSELAQDFSKLLTAHRESGEGGLLNILNQKNAAIFHEFSQEGHRKAQQLFEIYLGKASPDAIGYYQKKWAQASAWSKLLFLSAANYKSHPDTQVPFSGFPQDFFADIDTLDISRSDTNPSYQDYDTRLMQYYQARIGLPPYLDNNFLKVFPFVIATSSGHAQYHTLHTFLSRTVNVSNWHVNQRIKPYYEDFMKNCQDSAMTNSLQRDWLWNERWQPGVSASQLALPLSDGSSVELSRYKGKPLCLIIGEFFMPAELNAYAEFINDEANSDVQFVIAQIRRRPDIPDMLHDSLFHGMPNVEFLELRHHPKDMGPIGTTGYSSRWFILDPWLNVVDGNLQPSYRNADATPTKTTISYPEKLEELLEKARKAHRFTEEQKAEFKKIAGWTLMSILFTASIIGVTNKRRTQALKKKEAMKRQIQELEIKAIRSQMNPHFIFNALNSIQSLITEKRLEEANIYLADFASLLRSVLNNSQKPLVPLSDELEAVGHYCRLEQLRFPFTHRIEVKDGINTELLEVPSMIIQPLVENAIVHGFTPDIDNALLIICVNYVAGELVVTVSDNGGGLPVSGQLSGKGNGMGLKLVEDRVRNFNNSEKNANLIVQNNVVNDRITGVDATFMLIMD